MGNAGWPALVPFYSTYTLVKLVKRPVRYFWGTMSPILVYLIAFLLVGAYSLSGLLQEDSFTNYSPEMILFLLILITSAFMSIFCQIRVMSDLAKIFGKGIFTTIGLIFLPVVFNLILGLGKSHIKKEEHSHLNHSLHKDNEEHKHKEHSSK